MPATPHIDVPEHLLAALRKIAAQNVGYVARGFPDSDFDTDEDWERFAEALVGTRTAVTDYAAIQAAAAAEGVAPSLPAGTLIRVASDAVGVLGDRLVRDGGPCPDTLTEIDEHIAKAQLVRDLLTVIETAKETV